MCTLFLVVSTKEKTQTTYAKLAFLDPKIYQVEWWLVIPRSPVGVKNYAPQHLQRFKDVPGRVPGRKWSDPMGEITHFLSIS